MRKQKKCLCSKLVETFQNIGYKPIMYFACLLQNIFGLCTVRIACFSSSDCTLYSQVTRAMHFCGADPHLVVIKSETLNATLWTMYSVATDVILSSANASVIEGWSWDPLAHLVNWRLGRTNALAMLRIPCQHYNSLLFGGNLYPLLSSCLRQKEVIIRGFLGLCTRVLSSYHWQMVQWMYHALAMAFEPVKPALVLWCSGPRSFEDYSCASVKSILPWQNKQHLCLTISLSETWPEMTRKNLRKFTHSQQWHSRSVDTVNHGKSQILDVPSPKMPSKHSHFLTQI